MILVSFMFISFLLSLSLLITFYYYLPACVHPCSFFYFVLLSIKKNQYPRSLDYSALSCSSCLSGFFVSLFLTHYTVFLSLFLSCYIILNPFQDVLRMQRRNLDPRRLFYSITTISSSLLGCEGDVCATVVRWREEVNKSD